MKILHRKFLTDEYLSMDFKITFHIFWSIAGYNLQINNISFLMTCIYSSVIRNY